VGGIAINPERKQILQTLGATHGNTDPIPLIDVETNETVWPRLQFSG
jgi:hypothetical protein